MIKSTIFAKMDYKMDNIIFIWVDGKYYYTIK